MTKLSATAAPGAGTLERPQAATTHLAPTRVLAVLLVIALATAIAVAVSATPSTGPTQAATSATGRVRSGSNADVGMLDRSWASWYAPAPAPAAAISSIDPNIDVGLMDFASR